MQETKLYSKGQIRIPNLSVFETNRPQKGGGGLITAVHEKFNPALIQTEQDNPDILIVQCQIGANYVNLINGYGPQESDANSVKLSFFSSFETAIQSAVLTGTLMCAELDANSKIGMENISLDPHHISANGRMLMDIVDRNGLIVVNTTNKCIGTITRTRKAGNRIEKSVLDYFIVCQKFYEMILKMEIDEDRKFVLTKYSSRMGVQCVKESDHNPLICTLVTKWDNRKKDERKEVFKLKDDEGLNRFKEMTSNCPKLVQISKNSGDFLKDAGQWMLKIQDIMHKCFKKIRIARNARSDGSELGTLLKTKTELRERLGECPSENQECYIKLQENIAKIENEISVICSARNYSKSSERAFQ